MLHAPLTQQNCVNVDAVFHLVQDGNGAVKGLNPTEHVLFSRSLPRLAEELESTPAEIDAFRQATMEICTQKG